LHDERIDSRRNWPGTRKGLSRRCRPDPRQEGSHVESQFEGSAPILCDVVLADDSLAFEEIQGLTSGNGRNALLYDTPKSCTAYSRHPRRAPGDRDRFRFRVSLGDRLET